MLAETTLLFIFKYQLQLMLYTQLENFMRFSDHDGSLLRRQPVAMTIGHSPKG